MRLLQWRTVLMTLTMLSGNATAQFYNAPLQQVTPAVSWIDETGPSYSLNYTFQAAPGTNVQAFAYYGVPDSYSGKIPGIVLVHGGGGEAYLEWVNQWRAKGYAAIAMTHPGGSGYDAHRNNVGSIISAVSFLRSRPEVDASRIAVFGISWGGYYTSLATGLDQRITVAAAAYGCGYIHENSFWTNTYKDDTYYIDNVDPKNTMGGITQPMLWITGTNDPYYPMDSRRKSYRLTQGEKTVITKVKYTHDHPTPWKTPEIARFIDSHLLGTAALPSVSSCSWNAAQVTAPFSYTGTVSSAQLVYTTLNVPWSDYTNITWRTAAATVNNSAGTVSAAIPAGAKVFYFNLTDDQGHTVSSQHIDLTVDPAVSGTETVIAPTISPDGGTHDGPVQVTLSTATAGAQIRYTTDGSSPTSSSTLYSAPFTVSSSATVKAKAFKSGMDNSTEASATFTITIDTDGPVITSATAAGTPTSVLVTFNEQLNETDAETAGNYALNNGISVTGATLQSDGQTVLLTTGTLSENVTYTLTVNNVEDLAGNRISSNAQTTFSYLDAIPDMGAWWKFNETGGTTAPDASGNGNDATINGATRVTGIAGSALSFDGVDDYVDAGTFDPAISDMTIAAWLNWKGTNGAHQAVIAKRDSWSADGMRWQLARSYISNRVAFQQKNSSALFATDFPSTDTWFHVAVIKSGSTVKIYFDGVEAGSSSMDFGTKTDARIYLGSSGTGSESFNGMLDDVRIYNRALAVSELTAVMDTSTGGGIDTTVSAITATAPPVQPNKVTVTPNPIRSRAVFSLPGGLTGNATISIYNGGGELINTCTATGHKAVWNGTDQNGAVVEPGVYLYRMQSGNTVMNGVVYKTK